jgi:hypothetical protein
VATFKDKKNADYYAKQRRKQLTPGERKHYGMSYTAVTGGAKNKTRLQNIEESLNEEKYKLEQLAGGEWIVVDSKGTELARERNRINAIKAKKDLEESVNEGLNNYSLLDFFKEMQSFPAAGVDSDDIKDASSPKNKKKTVKNTPALKGLLDQWMEGRYDEDPGYLVDELRDLLESRSINEGLTQALRNGFQNSLQLAAFVLNNYKEITGKDFNPDADDTPPADMKKIDKFIAKTVIDEDDFWQAWPDIAGDAEWDAHNKTYHYEESVKFKNLIPLNEFGPMRGSNNRSWKTRDLVDRIGDLEDMLFNGNVRRAEKEWEMVSGQYLTGEHGAEHWDDLDDNDLRSAIDDAEHIMKKYKMSESVNVRVHKLDSKLKKKLDAEYDGDYELKNHPDKRDKFYELLLKHAPFMQWDQLKKEFMKLFKINYAGTGSNMGELLEYFYNMVRKELKIGESINEGKGQDLATTYIAKLRKEFRKLNDNELEEFNETLANAFGYNYSKIKESLNEYNGPKFRELKSKLSATPPRWSNYVAQNKDGKWIWHENKPKMTSTGYESTGQTLDMDLKTDNKYWNEGPTYFFTFNGKVTESVNEADQMHGEYLMQMLKAQADDLKK